MRNSGAERDDWPANEGPTPRVSGLALAAFMIPIFALFGFERYAGLLGIIFGLIALYQIKMSAGALTGKIFAIAGIGLSMLIILYFALLLPRSKPAHKSRQLRTAVSCCYNEDGLEKTHGLPTRPFICVQS